ncbi:MIP/aquaporin family protein [Jatrophihabitans fulvus]
MSTARSDAARRCAAELLGTALLVIGGVGTAVLAPQVGQLGIALAFGFTLLVLAFAIGPISGAHVNPAVTIGLTIAKRLPVKDAVGYVVAQLLGGIAGAAVVRAIAANRKGYDLTRDGLGANGWGDASKGGYGFDAALVAEIVLTAVLVFTVLAATASAAGSASAAVAGIPIGISLAVIHLVAIPIDGTSVNPARSLGPALFARGDALDQLWLFLVAPVAGAIVAAVLYAVLMPGREAKPVTDAADSTADPRHAGV